MGKKRPFHGLFSAIFSAFLLVILLIKVASEHSAECCVSEPKKAERCLLENGWHISFLQARAAVLVATCSMLMEPKFILNKVSYN